MWARTLAPADGQLFADLYSVMDLGERFIHGSKTIRALVHTFDALDALAVPVRNAEGREIGKRLVETGGVLTLEDAEADLVAQIVAWVITEGRAVPPGAPACRPIPARRAAALLAWLNQETQ